MNVIAHGLSLSESIAAPRFGSLGIHLKTMVPGDLQLVEGFPPQVLEAVETGGVRFLRRGSQDPLIQRPSDRLRVLDRGRDRWWTAGSRLRPPAPGHRGRRLKAR